MFLVSYVHVCCIFVFAHVQRNSACLTGKGALEICALLILLLFDWLTVSLRLVYDLCHPSVAVETMAAERKTYIQQTC